MMIDSIIFTFNRHTFNSNMYSTYWIVKGFEKTKKETTIETAFLHVVTWFGFLINFIL